VLYVVGAHLEVVPVNKMGKSLEYTRGALKHNHGTHSGLKHEKQLLINTFNIMCVYLVIILMVINNIFNLS
jgi:hypothetical protein